MTDGKRDELISDIEEITARIEKLEPQVYEEEAMSGKRPESINRLMELREELAQKTECLEKLDREPLETDR
jgi:hypothetical protein